MKIKDQAAAALMADPFAKTFICDKPCKHNGCGGLERYVINGFTRVVCNRRRNLEVIARNPERHRENQRLWNEKNHEYRLVKARADWHRKKDAQLAAFRS